jgi:transcriptional regulator with XRE-family HTH domain
VNEAILSIEANMLLSAGEKIKVILGRRGMTHADLAEKTSQSRTNISNKISRDNFSEKELKEIAVALNCTFESVFKLKDTGEEI